MKRRKATRKKAARRKTPRKVGAQKSQPPQPLTRSELAQWLDVSTTTVDRWRLRGLPQGGTPGKPLYVLSEVVSWLRERDRIAAQPDVGEINLEELRKRKALADTELAELQLEEARALVVPIDIVLDRVGEVMSSIRARLLTFPSRYAAQLAQVLTAPAMKTALRKAVGELLDELKNEDDIARDAREEGARSPRVRPKTKGRAPKAAT